MEAIVFNFFRILFRTVGMLILSGLLVAALLDVQKKAFNSKSVGLTSMLRINQQLVGKTK